ncbi:PAS domain-containing protein [Kordiimonas sp. SCSIO 12610]|uniref:PAS domain-containing protein n=1 Tax=Kordiimonas sp. SCSIO 12610 TaxID=2829597 RepID=UPI002108D634|nr:PAS domain-containing protein [Kordiimonas sp. SCSIO 12610]UTW56492.1 PAS domain-containing protein [Kordiimonas sp. SCSIO 12610]
MNMLTTGLSLGGNRPIFEGLKKLNIHDLQATHPAIQFHTYWNKLLECNPSGIIERGRFNPMAVPKLLPWISVLERTSDTDHEFQYRLAGSEVVNLLGEDPKGRLFGYSLPKTTRKLYEEYLLQTYSLQQAIFLTGKFQMPNGNTRHLELGIFPISSDGKSLDQIISITTPQIRYPQFQSKH